MAIKPTPEKKGNGCLRGCLIFFLIFVVLPIILLVGYFFYAARGLFKSDQEVLKTYQPAPEIIEIVEKNTLTNKGKAILYRTDPELVEGEIFRRYCFANGVEALGCYAPRPGGGPFGGRKIFLLKIDDPKFADHKFSAAVHEMLHSAYDRLNVNERKNLDALLEAELAKRQDDPHLTGPLGILKSRKTTTAKTINSELHSKFGVEYSDLSPELENYYKQYFNDRSSVVALYKNGGFDSRVRRMDEINSELKTLAPQLTSLQNQLTTYQNANDAAGFNSLIGQYNNLVSRYNGLASESQKIFAEVETFYKYFNPNYKPPEVKK